MGAKPMLSFATAWINKFDKVPKARGLLNLEHCDDVANGFGEMMEQGRHIWVIKKEQDQPKAVDWIDKKPLKPAPGADDVCHGKGDDAKLGHGIDSVDFALISSHGSMRYPDEFVLWFNDRTRERVCSCRMRLGNARLKWLVLDCCRSLDNRPDLASVNPDRTWREAFDGLHSIFGFTGQSTDGPWVDDRGACFAARIVMLDGELAEAWLDCASSHFAEDNPGVAVAGRDLKDAVDRLANEKVSSSFDSIPNKEVKVIAWLYRRPIRGKPSPTGKDSEVLNVEDRLRGTTSR